MDNKERFDQLESLLADFSRKQDQQGDQLKQVIHELNRQGEAIGRQEQRLNDIGDQIGDIINILKISEARHTKSEKRQDAMLTQIQEQGRRTDEQGRRTDLVIEALQALVGKLDNTNLRVDGAVESQRQLITFIRLNTETLDDHAPRIQRLEDDALRQAS